MEGLPLLPGYRYQDPTIEDYKLTHKFDFLNGYRVIRDSNIGIGGRPIDAASSAYIRDLDPVQYDPSLTYGRVRDYGYQQFVPEYVLFAQKCLRFKGYFRQGVFGSPNEHFRIRYVNILYFLEDDTMSVIEPVVDNAGFPQGKLVKRSKINKNGDGDTFHWTDLNVGIDICIYGVVYHIADCDAFTREFLTSQGVDVNAKEDFPMDPYTNLRERMKRLPIHGNQRTSDDARRRFLEYDTMVLSFTATWNEDLYCIMYFLTDDTIAIREIQKANCGKDPVPMLLKRMKIPKDWKNFPSSYPGISMEYTDAEITEYYAPRDFRVGESVLLFGRRFFLHDCDRFTRKYYLEMMGFKQADAIPIPKGKEESIERTPALLQSQSEVPDVTYATCIPFMPEQPKKDLIRQLANFPKKLRYSAHLDAVHPEDEGRDFVFEYSLSEGTIQIIELEKRNSGRREGCFLKATLVPKPNSRRDNPEFYTPEDFYIGARINIFNHYFIINGADLFVYRYIVANPEKFSQTVRDNIRNYFAQRNMLSDEVTDEAKRIMKTEDLECKINENYIKNDVNLSSSLQKNDKHCPEACLFEKSIQLSETCKAEHSPAMNSNEKSATCAKKELKWSNDA